MYVLVDRLGFIHASPRSSSSLGLFSKYDGNVLGGALLGAGMAMSGSCPGTLYAQLAAGVKTGLYALEGAIVGGILWSGPVSRLVADLRQRKGIKPEVGIVSDQLGLSKSAALLLLGTACAAVAVATTALTPRYPFPGAASISGVTGGLLIGGAQVVSMLTRRSMLGVSGSYEEAGRYFWWAVSGKGGRPSSWANMLFASGMLAGAWAMLKLVMAAPGPVREVAPLLATAGGVLMAMGARLAGGCTSGHGISGISLLSTSSAVTIATAFAAGGLVAPLLQQPLPASVH